MTGSGRERLCPLLGKSRVLNVSRSQINSRNMRLSMTRLLHGVLRLADDGLDIVRDFHEECIERLRVTRPFLRFDTGGVTDVGDVACEACDRVGTGLNQASLSANFDTGIR